MSERRYRDAEVRKILELATRAPEANARTGRGAEGLTLADIQSIGMEVGVAPDEIARAAAALDASPRKRRRSLGMPIEVLRTVPLPRALTDAEWEQVVAELRSTFRARGRVVVQGNLREWSNGNLHACVEPAESGYRLRLGTIKGDAAGVNALGAAGLVSGAVAFGVAALTGDTGSGAAVGVMLGASGTGAFLANLLRLPRWAEERERQMQHIEARVRKMIGAPADG